MQNELTHFIENRTFAYPGANVGLVELTDAFRASLPPAAVKFWPRGRILLELKRSGYVIGKRSDKRTGIGGISLAPAPVWARQGGRLKLVSPGEPQAASVVQPPSAGK